MPAGGISSSRALDLTSLLQLLKMFPTKRLAQGGFFRRSADELGRLSKIGKLHASDIPIAKTNKEAAWNTEALHTPTKPYSILNFENESEVKACKTMADRAVGGFSTASLDFEPADPSTNTPPHARFHGTISTKLPENWRVERTGNSTNLQPKSIADRRSEKTQKANHWHMHRLRRLPQPRQGPLAFRSPVLGC
jgi:hypothetical protein